jgi:hypothetical protein
MPKKTRPNVSAPVGQADMPGCEPDFAGALQRKAGAPLKPAKAQKACDLGLFGNAAGQLDLVDLMKKPKPQPRAAPPLPMRPATARLPNSLNQPLLATQPRRSEKRTGESPRRPQPHPSDGQEAIVR